MGKTEKNKGKPPKSSAAKPSGKEAKPVKSPTYSELYERHGTAARMIPDGEVVTCRADVRVAFANIRLGIKAVLGTKEQIAFVRQHLPKIPIDDVVLLPDVGRALIFSTSKVIGRVASPNEIAQKLSRISAPREQMLSQAEILAKRGKLDKDHVAKIRAGSGKLDSAHDVVALVDLFTDNAKSLKGQHPFTKEELAEARETAEWLLENLTPGGVRAEKKKKGAAEDMRDRLWTMVMVRYALLRKIGYYIHGDDVDLYVPKLQSRVTQAVSEEEDESSAESAPEAPETP